MLLKLHHLLRQLFSLWKGFLLCILLSYAADKSTLSDPFPVWLQEEAALPMWRKCISLTAAVGHGHSSFLSCWEVEPLQMLPPSCQAHCLSLTLRHTRRAPGSTQLLLQKNGNKAHLGGWSICGRWRTFTAEKSAFQIKIFALLVWKMY